MKHLNELISRYPELDVCKNSIIEIINAICSMHNNGGKLLICGNGGSAADCEHISGELLKGFLLERKPDTSKYNGAEHIISKLQNGITAIPLPSFTSLTTAFSNDENSVLSFAQLVFVMGKAEDVFLGISTSGNSQNVVSAAKTAKAKNLKTIAMTGQNESELSDICDIVLRVPEKETFKIQELHQPVYHAICAQVEEILF